MSTRNQPTHIDDPGDLTLKVEGYTIELGTLLWGPAMNMPPHIARWAAKELMMMAAEVDRKQARDMCDNSEKVMER